MLQQLTIKNSYIKPSLNQFANNETINAKAILKAGALSALSSSISFFCSLPLGCLTDEVATLVGYNLG